MVFGVSQLWLSEFLGKQLYDVGWRQGASLPTLPWSVISNVDDPITRIAKADQQRIDDQIRRKSETNPTEVTSPSYAIASGLSQSQRLLDFSISQDCDIVKDPNLIPTIFAMRAFVS